MLMSGIRVIWNWLDCITKRCEIEQDSDGDAALMNSKLLSPGDRCVIECVRSDTSHPLQSTDLLSQILGALALILVQEHGPRRSNTISGAVPRALLWPALGPARDTARQTV
jgi:hypothetical protein